MIDLIAQLKATQQVGPERHRFSLVKLLGTHACGVLWRATDLATSSKTTVTLQFIPEMLVKRPGFMEALRDLVIKTRRCKHRHQLSCFGLFNAQGLVFLAFDKVDGLTLADLFSRSLLTRMSDAQKQGLLSQLAQALDDYHKQLGQGQGSVSPELIFLNAGQGVRMMMIDWRPLVDFDQDDVTLPPDYLQYASAEVMSGSYVTIQSDIFAYAAVLYHVWVGQALFLLGDGVKTRQEVLLPENSKLDADKLQVLQQAFAAEPEVRQSAVLTLFSDFFAKKTDPQSVLNEEAKLTDYVDPDLSDYVADANDGEFRKASPLSMLQSRLTFLQHPLFQHPVLRSAKTRYLSTFFSGVILGGLGVFLWLYTPESSVDVNAHLQDEPVIVEEAEEVSDLNNASPALALEEEVAVDETDDAQENASIPTVESQRETIEEPQGLFTFRDQFDDGFGPLMVQLPQGSFLMGDMSRPRVGDDNERPVRIVSIEYNFALSVHPVTFNEYDQFAEETGRALPGDEGWGRGNRPVINVSWNDARDYVNWLQQQTGEPYRLASEAEWEYAVRAGAGANWWWGNDPNVGYAVCAGCGSAWDAQQTAPVGSVPANEWGLTDMHGNVDEWVEDCYREDYVGAPVDGSALVFANCNERVLRGGAWFEAARNTRSSSRYRQVPTVANDGIGFRVALSLP